VDLEISLEEGKGLPQKKKYPLGERVLEELHQYIQTNKKQDGLEYSSHTADLQHQQKY